MFKINLLMLLGFIVVTIGYVIMGLPYEGFRMLLGFYFIVLGITNLILYGFNK